MLPTFVLLDILKCLNRDELEKIQEVNRAINNIIKSEFASKPLRLFYEDCRLYIRVENGELLLMIRDYFASECFVPTSPGWKQCQKLNCPHRYQIDEMRPFLAEYMRLRNSFIVIINDAPYTSEHVAMIGSFAHIWKGQTLHINDDSDNDKNSLSLILSNSNVLQCRALRLFNRLKEDVVLDKLQYPALYKLHAIYFRSEITANSMFGIVQKKAGYPHSNTTFVFTSFNPNELVNEINEVRKVFLKSTKPCRLKMIIEVCKRFYDPDHVLDENLNFRAENNQTGEVMVLKSSARAEMNEIIDVQLDGEDWCLLLERCSI